MQLRLDARPGGLAAAEQAPCAQGATGVPAGRRGPVARLRGPGPLRPAQRGGPAGDAGGAGAAAAPGARGACAGAAWRMRRGRRCAAASAASAAPPGAPPHCVVELGPVGGHGLAAGEHGRGPASSS